MSVRSSFTALFFLASFSALAGPAAFAQSRTNSTGTGGIHEIRGRVYLPSGKALDTPIKVELQSTTHGTLSLESDRNGGYSFRALAPGNYSIVVDAGDAFEIARDYAMIDPEVQLPIRRVPVPKVVTIPIYLQLKRAVAAKVGVLNAKLSQVPKGSIEHYERGLGLMRDNKLQEAAVEFRRSVALYPAMGPAHTELGKIHLKAAEVDPAISEFQLALRFDASDFEANLGYGIALLNKGNLDDAVKPLRSAAELNANAVTPRYYLGLVFVQLHDLENAQKEMEAAKQLARNSSFPLVHRYLGGIYWQRAAMNKAAGERRDLYRLAIDELEQYIKLVPKAQDASKIRDTIVQLRTKVG